MINLKNLHFSYEKKELFENVSITISSGGICGLLGLNGAGKSTFLKLVSGLLYPSAGEISVLDHNPIKREAALLSDIFFLPEEFILPAMSPSTYCKIYAPFYPNFDYAGFHKYMKGFNLPDDKKLSQFSYGMKKMFLISFGLATMSKIYIMDEPTNGLAIPSKDEFKRLIAQATSSERLFIISTHQVLDVEKLLDSIIIVNNGDISLQADKTKIFDTFVMQKNSNEGVIGTDECLYSRQTEDGYLNVYSNKKNGKDITPINIETFFNMAITNPTQVQKTLGESK